MNAELEFAYKLRHHLNHATDHLDQSTALRLHEARQEALQAYRPVAGGLSLAGVGHIVSAGFLQHARVVAAFAMLAIGIAGSYQWNNYQQAVENAELDSALLTDELPINAYLDRGFHAWLDHRSSPSQ